VTALEVFRALLGPKEDDEPEEGVLFALPEEPVASCVPCCDWCGMQGPPIPADLGISKRWKFGDTWWPMVSFGLLSIDEHKRASCEKSGEHPEEWARLVARYDSTDVEDDDEEVEHDDVPAL
jgi:hypothetical protein